MASTAHMSENRFSGLGFDSDSDDEIVKNVSTKNTTGTLHFHTTKSCMPKYLTKKRFPVTTPSYMRKSNAPKNSFPHLSRHAIATKKSASTLDWNVVKDMSTTKDKAPFKHNVSSDTTHNTLDKSGQEDNKKKCDSSVFYKTGNYYMTRNYETQRDNEADEEMRMTMEEDEYLEWLREKKEAEDLNSHDESDDYYDD